jgi:hypothetical protein
LGEAREMMLSVPALHRRGAIWQYAAMPLPDAEAQLTRALKTEGLI